MSVSDRTCSHANVSSTQATLVTGELPPLPSIVVTEQPSTRQRLTSSMTSLFSGKNRPPSGHTAAPRTPEEAQTQTSTMDIDDTSQLRSPTSAPTEEAGRHTAKRVSNVTKPSN